MFSAILFDFNGVIIDDEPQHCGALIATLAEYGYPLDRETYYRDYLGFDDRECFRFTFARDGDDATPVRIAEAIERKNEHYFQAIGADMAYIGTRFLATTEAHVLPEYKQMLVDSTSDDVVYTSLFTGVKGNYLRRSVAAAGLDPDSLPEADKSKMNFGSGGNMEKKAWRDIWSGGQGVGNIHDVRPTAEVVARMVAGFEATRQRLC